MIIYFIKDINNIIQTYNYEPTFEYTDSVEIDEATSKFIDENFPFVKFLDNTFFIESTLLEKTKLIYEKKQRINELKQFLKDTDWMTTVNYELQQEGLPIKYTEITTIRKSWRSEINILELELEKLEV